MGIDILTLAAARAGKGGGSASKYKQPEWGAETAIVDILPEETQTAVQTQDGMAIFALPAANYPLVGGNVYEVNYNGTSYSCVCHEEKSGADGGMYCLGNVGIFGYEGVEITEEPFVIIFNYGKTIEEQGALAQMIALDGSETVTLYIRGAEEIIHHIPAEYTENESVLRVNLGYNYSGADKTYDEIMAAINAGKFVYARMQGTADENSPLTFFLVLSSIDSQSRICFALLVMGEVICCNPDNTWEKYNT